MSRQISGSLVPKNICLLLAILLSSLTFSSCGQRPAAVPTDNQRSGAYQNQEQERNVPSSSTASQESVSQDQVLQAQAQQARKVEVLFSARVRKILPEDTKGLPHELFLLDLNNGTTVKVAHDIKYAPRVPIQVGDLVTVKGEYIWNKRGGVVHWTHHSDTPRHEGGYIDYAGNRYE